MHEERQHWQRKYWEQATVWRRVKIDAKTNKHFYIGMFTFQFIHKMNGCVCVGASVEKNQIVRTFRVVKQLAQFRINFDNIQRFSVSHVL